MLQVDCLHPGNGFVCNWWCVCLVPILLRSPMTVSRGLRLGGTPPLEWSVVVGTLWFLASPVLLSPIPSCPSPSPPLPPPSYPPYPPPTCRCAGRHEHSNRTGSHHTWNVLFRYGCWIRVSSHFQLGVTHMVLGRFCLSWDWFLVFSPSTLPIKMSANFVKMQLC